MKEWEQRNLSFHAGFRRATLILDEDPEVRKNFVEDFYDDCINHDELLKITDEWAETSQQRSMWNRRGVLQLQLCLTLGNWKITERLNQ